MKNNENPLIEEDTKYMARYENKYVKYAKITFAETEEEIIFENKNYLSRKKRPLWYNKETNSIYLGIVDANPTAKLAEFSTTKISSNGTKWKLVKRLVRK